MVHLLVNWLLSALALWIVAQIIPGIQVRSYGTALLATVVIAIVNVLVGWPLKILTFPLTLLTLGLFLLILNAFLLKLASIFVPGFVVRGFLPAFFGSIVLTILGYILRHMVVPRHAGLFY
ncbi:MAG: phage holin family protein [Bryobacteraceae bacterium]|jgi:putative membrane protein